MRRALFAAAALALAGCQRSGPSEPVKLKAPEPLPRLYPFLPPLEDGGLDASREALYRVAPFKPWGPGIPGKAARAQLSETALELNGAKVDVEDRPALEKVLQGLGGQPVLIVAQGETWVTHLAPLLAALDDLKLETWLAHPEGAFAYPVTLRDAAAFGAWLDEPVPGKVRVIQRADGFELSTNMGKLLAADPNGPSVPVRGGVQDLPTLQKGLAAVKGRFKSAPDVCFMPSFGTPVADAVRALAANWQGTDGPSFEALCFVYSRPVARDGGS
jgi:hypothetical protein